MWPKMDIDPKKGNIVVIIDIFFGVCYMINRIIESSSFHMYNVYKIRYQT